MNDTLPFIEIKASNLAYPAIFEGSFLEGTKVSQWGMKLSFHKMEIGVLSVTSGKIIAADPASIHKVQPFEHNFPIGNFPVELAIVKKDADERVAYARIMFNDNNIKEWKYALKPDQEDLPISDSKLLGYRVDSGIGMFIDMDGINQFKGLNPEDYWEAIFMDKFAKNHRSSWSYMNYNLNQNNLIAFSTGFGDGVYGTYIGIDKAGQICQLLTDFGIVNWWKEKNKTQK